MKTSLKAKGHKSKRAQALVTCALVTCAIVNAFGGEITQDSRNLLKEIIRPIDQPQNNVKADQLKQLIVQIRSIQFESKRDAERAGDTAEPKPETISAVPEPIESENTYKTGVPDSAAIYNRKSVIGNRLQEMLKDPNTVANPFELAEALFRNGLPGPAGLCYKRALAEIGANDPNTATERCWILFQIGNCLQNDDPNAAKESYAELIRTYPDSPWVEIAKSRHALIEWNQQDRPDKLIEELK
jgi:hypothetical protein